MAKSFKNFTRLVTVLLSVAVLVLSSSTTTLANDDPELSARESFYIGNDIVFYDPDDPVCALRGLQSDTANAVGSDNAEKIFNFLTKTSFKELLGKPMSPIQAIGVLANFAWESGLDPGREQDGGGPAYGIAQWEGSRRAELEEFARERGQPVDDLNLQLAFLKKELDGSEGTHLTNGGFDKVTTVAEATEVFLVRFERAGIPHLDKRLDLAEEFQQRFGVTGGTIATPGNPCGIGGIPRANNGDFTDNTTFVTWSQCAHHENGGPWGTMSDGRGRTVCNVGCGPVSIAMVIRNMAGADITPTEVVNYYTRNNMWNAHGGTDPVHMQKAAEHWGLRHESINSRSLADYQKHLDAGALLVINGQGSAPFLSHVRHYVVVRGITPDGQKFIVSDPGTGTAREWPVMRFMLQSNPHLSTAFYPGN